ncbi:beta-lactamase family protein [Xanthomonas campestris pv. asclepiadis]|uniref:serine hydrolase n=1 Tax=Xanthomonas campestris TaxID=339 RepID=UPI001E337021|nr:serine hydrolase domain-containing protein [Xanthomonas campestris]MCC4615894.1 beta-lactamase family protein [Xanthomonas campestris pv. asclepiadis]
MLTHLIERVYGQHYAHYLQRALFQLLGMQHRRYDNHLAVIANRAHGYRRSKGQLQNADFISMSQPQDTSGLISTVDDLARWHRACATAYRLSLRCWRRRCARPRWPMATPGRTASAGSLARYTV